MDNGAEAVQSLKEDVHRALTGSDRGAYPIREDRFDLEATDDAVLVRYVGEWSGSRGEFVGRLYDLFEYDIDGDEQVIAITGRKT